MKVAKFLAIFGCLLMLIGMSSTAHAQAPLVTRCMQIVLNYVGKPLVKGAVEAAGGEVAKYLLNRGSTSISRDDVQQLQRLGLTECDIRQQLEDIYFA
jgi:hypothetical protein